MRKNNQKQVKFYYKFVRGKISVFVVFLIFDKIILLIVALYLTLKSNGILVKEMDHSIKLEYKNSFAPKSAFEMDDTDFIIVVGEKEKKVHKKVLMEVSPVFVEMFESGIKESIVENKMFITNFTFKTVDTAVDICYGINVSMKYSLENLLSLYKFGYEYRITIIKDVIEDYLIKDISPSNVVYLFKFSSRDSFNVKTLYQKCIEFIMKCSKESIPIYTSDSLDEKFLAEMVLNTFSSQY